LEYIRDGLTWLLNFLYGITSDYGLAIILLTVVLRVVLYPLFVKQTRSMAMMRELQPQMAEIQKKYKDKPEEYQRRVLELYRKNKVNPLGGCLPMLVQLPILWALFQVLRDFKFGAGFLWLKSLSAPDQYYILPILSGLTTYTQTLQTGTDPSQKAISLIMPVFIGWISLSLPAGLVLYWVVSNLLSMGQQWIVNRQMAAARNEAAPARAGDERATKGQAARPVQLLEAAEAGADRGFEGAARAGRGGKASEGRRKARKKR